MNLGFAGQTVIVTGGAHGLGRAIAHAVLFFASEYAAWITGQVLSVNGGA